MLKILKNNWYFYSLLLLTLIVHHVWFFNNSLLTNGDWFAPDMATLRDFLALPSIWNTHSFPYGEINIVSSSYPLKLLMGLLSFIGFEWNMIERILFMWPISILLVLSPFYLLKKILHSEKAAFFGSIVFAFNSYISLKQTDQLDITLAFSLIPIVILLFIRALEKKNFSSSIWCGLVCFILSFYEFRIFYLTVWIFIFYLIYDFWISRLRYKSLPLKKKLISIFKKLFLAAIPIILVFLLNIYWLLPLITQGALTHNEIFNRGLFGDSFMNVTQAIALFHPFWTGASPAVFEAQIIPWQFFLVPIFAWIGFYLGRKNRYIPFFAFISILGIFLTKQSGEPFESFYFWAYKTIPGFNAFREASKFYVLIALGYSVLIGSLIEWSDNNLSSNLQKAVLSSAVLLLFLLNTIPFFTGSAQTLFIVKSFPKDYKLINHFINEKPEFFRVMWVPTVSRFSTAHSTHPAVSAQYAIELDWNNYIGYKAKDFRVTKNQITDYFGNSEFQKLIIDSSIKYIIVPSIESDPEIFNMFDANHDFFTDKLNSLKFLKRVTRTGEKFAIYEVQNFHPHFYSENDPVSFTKISDTKYKIKLPKNFSSQALTFSEKYNPNWQLRMNDKPQEGIHSKTDADLNSFQIDTTKIPRGATVTVEFPLQKTEDIGFLISTGTLLSALLFVAFSYAKKR